jgi:hypothetical protein
MKTAFVKSTLKLFALSAVLLAAPATRAEAPKGWDVANDCPRLGEARMVIRHGEPQHADYDVGPANAIESRDESVAGAGSGEPQVEDEGLTQDSKTFVEKIFSDP